MTDSGLDIVALITSVVAGIAAIGNIYSTYAGKGQTADAIKAVREAAESVRDAGRENQDIVSKHFTATQQQLDRMIRLLGDNLKKGPDQK